MASYGVLEEHTTLDPDFSILAFAFCWACGLSWNEAWANVKSSLLDIPMSFLPNGPLNLCINWKDGWILGSKPLHDWMKFC
jgi:hypothetical protein